MIAGLRSGCALAVVATILLLAPAVALAHTGKLVDPDGKPIEGARICYILNEAEGQTPPGAWRSQSRWHAAWSCGGT